MIGSKKQKKSMGGKQEKELHSDNLTDQECAMELSSSFLSHYSISKARRLCRTIAYGVAAILTE